MAEDRFDRLLRYLDEIEFAFLRGEPVSAVQGQWDAARLIWHTTPDTDKDDIRLRYRALEDFVAKKQLEDNMRQPCSIMRPINWKRPTLCPGTYDDCGCSSE